MIKKKIRIDGEEITIHCSESGVVDAETELAIIKWVLLQIVRILDDYSVYLRSCDERLNKLLKLGKE